MLQLDKFVCAFLIIGPSAFPWEENETHADYMAHAAKATVLTIRALVNYMTVFWRHVTSKEDHTGNGTIGPVGRGFMMIRVMQSQKRVKKMRRIFHSLMQKQTWDSPV